MRILRVADVNGRSAGGMSIFMRRSSMILREWGHEVDHAFHEDLGASWLRGPVRRLAVHWLVLRLVLRHRRRGPHYDVVEVHEPAAAGYCLARRLLRGAKLPPCVVISYGAEELHWRAHLRRLRARAEIRLVRSRILVPLTLVFPSRYAFTHAAHVLAPSADDLRYLTAELRIPRNRLTRVDSGVAEDWFTVAHTKPLGALRVLFIGTWIDRKGTHELAEAWSQLVTRGTEMRLTATCTVLPENEVLSAFGTAAATVTVHRFASDPQLRESLSSHDVFVLPSWFEGGIALAALQAAAAGLACVVTAVGGNVDLFRAENSEADGALLIPPHEPEPLAHALERLAHDPALVSRLGERARARAQTFRWTATASRCLTGYRAARV